MNGTTSKFVAVIGVVAVLALASTAIAADDPPPVPLGNATDQCWTFTFKDHNIKAGDGAVPVRDNANTCNKFTGGSVVEGSASFNVCCIKVAGDCQDCNKTVEVEVRKNGTGDVHATETVNVTCKPQNQGS